MWEESMLGRVRVGRGFALAVVTVVLAAAAACGGSKGDGSSGEPETKSSSGGSGSSGSGPGVEGGADDTDASSSSGIDTSGWVCPSSIVFGEYSSGCVDCIETMCSTQLAQCETMSCQLCEGPTFECEAAMCDAECSPDGGGGPTGEGGTASSSGAGGSGDATTGACAGLMTCCGYLQAYDPSGAAMCTSVASGGNESSCQAVLNKLPSEVASFCE
jgi:hypothetical protein